jgi:hypothetical protein
MENEVKEKQELKKSSIVSMSLNGIPRSVHNKILKYRTDIIGKYRKPFSVKEAYVEFLKEQSKAIH